MTQTTQTPDTAATAGGNRIIQGAEDARAFARGDESKAVLHERPAGDLISRARDLLAVWEFTPDEGDPMIDVLLGVISETLGLLRAIPTAPEAGDVERLKGQVMWLQHQRDDLQELNERAEARLAEVEAENVRLRKVARLYDTAVQIAAIESREVEQHPADATAALSQPAQGGEGGA